MLGKKVNQREQIMRYAEDQIHAYLHPYSLRLIIIECRNDFYREKYYSYPVNWVLKPKHDKRYSLRHSIIMGREL